MKLSRNTLISAFSVIAVALGCASFVDTSPKTVPGNNDTGIAHTQAEADVFNRTNHVEDIITIRPR